MFFIGVFGVKEGQKEIGTENNVICPGCGRLTSLHVVKQSSYFHVFFIPVFRWNVKYYAKSLCCGQVFEVSTEAGREFEEGKSGAISQADLVKLGRPRASGSYTCMRCNGPVEDGYRFCPHCGTPRDGV